MFANTPMCPMCNRKHRFLPTFGYKTNKKSQKTLSAVDPKICLIYMALIKETAYTSSSTWTVNVTVPKVCLALFGLMLICVVCVSWTDSDELSPPLERAESGGDETEESYVFRRIDFRCKSLSKRARASSNWWSRSRIRRFCDCDWFLMPLWMKKDKQENNHLTDWNLYLINLLNSKHFHDQDSIFLRWDV